MLYEVILFQTYFGQSCVNRWTYNSAGVPASVLGSFALTSALGFIQDGTPPAYPADTLFDRIRNLQTQSVSYNSVLVSALSDYDLNDFYTRPFISNTTGKVTGEGMSPTQAYGFRTNRVTRAVRRATKRFVGVWEGWSAPGGIIAGDGIGWMQQLADEMSAPAVYDDEGNTITFTPCVVSQREVVVDGKLRRRYWPTLDEQLAHTAQGILWESYPQVRTQNSRQYGRGV